MNNDLHEIVINFKKNSVETLIENCVLVYSNWSLVGAGVVMIYVRG